MYWRMEKVNEYGNYEVTPQFIGEREIQIVAAKVNSGGRTMRITTLSLH